MITYISAGIVMLFFGYVCKSDFAIALGVIPITVICLSLTIDIENWLFTLIHTIECNSLPLFLSDAIIIILTIIELVNVSILFEFLKRWIAYKGDTQ